MSILRTEGFRVHLSKCRSGKWRASSHHECERTFNRRLYSSGYSVFYHWRRTNRRKLLSWSRLCCFEEFWWFFIYNRSSSQTKIGCSRVDWTKRWSALSMEGAIYTRNALGSVKHVKVNWLLTSFAPPTWLKKMPQILLKTCQPKAFLRK